ncbi:acyl-CoA dehydrogenase family protein [Streptomyces sp. NPDC002067]
MLAGVDGVADGAVRGAVLAGPGRAGAAVEPGRGGSGAAPEGDASTAGPGRAPAPVEPGRGAAAVEPGPPASAPGGSGSGALPPGGPAHGGPARTDAAPETARPGDAAPESVPSGGLAEGLLSRIAAGDALVSLCLLSPAQPYALDADAADVVLVVEGEVLRRAEPVGPVRRSADPARRLVRPGPGPVLARGPGVAAAAARAYDMAALATAAQALGLGRALLDATVRYVRERTQFGVPVGSFQAVKHRLADTLLGLEFAEPLVYGAALALARGEADGRAVSAAKVAAGEAAYAAARTALHLHGALGYTEEPDLSLWIRKARPLRDAWGTPAAHRARVLAP